MFVSKKIKIVVMVAAVATAVVFNSCGGKKTSQAQVAASGGFVTVTTPASEMEQLQRQLEELNVPSGIGIARSTDEMIARNQSADQARAQLATSVGVHVQRLMESYAQNVNNEAKSIWEEGVRQLTDQHLTGARIHKSIQQFNPENSQWQVYTLVVLDPNLFKDALLAATARNEEFELRVKKDDMMSRMDANIAEYDNRFRNR